MTLNLEDIRAKWILQEGARLKEKRKYPHFDPIVGIDKKREDLIFTPKKVEGFSFFPLIKSVKEERRRKLDENSNLRYVTPKLREICYAAHIDSLIYSWYGCVLNTWYGHFLTKNKISQNIIAYRNLDRSTPEFVKEVTDFIKTKGACDVLCFDVTKFFNRIGHGELKNNWLLLLSRYGEINDGRMCNDHFKIYKKVTKYQFVEIERVEKFFPEKRIPSINGRYLPDSSFLEFIRTKNSDLKLKGENGLIEENADDFGIPQGLPLSGVLANLSMLNFDLAISAYAKKHGGIYRRYSDDILLVVNPGIMNSGEEFIRDQLEKIGLESNEKKTERRLFRCNEKGLLECRNEKGILSNFQYLGIEFDGVWVFIRSQSVSRYHRKIRQSIQRSAHALIKRGGKILKHREFYRKFIKMSPTSKELSFFTYTIWCHDIFKSYSKINNQITRNKIIKVIKDTITKTMLPKI